MQLGQGVLSTKWKLAFVKTLHGKLQRKFPNTVNMENSTHSQQSFRASSAECLVSCISLRNPIQLIYFSSFFLCSLLVLNLFNPVGKRRGKGGKAFQIPITLVGNAFSWYMFEYANTAYRHATRLRSNSMPNIIVIKVVLFFKKINYQHITHLSLHLNLPLDLRRSRNKRE